MCSQVTRVEEQRNSETAKHTHDTRTQHTTQHNTTQHTTHNTQHTTHNTQHKHNTQHQTTNNQQPTTNNRLSIPSVPILFVCVTFSDGPQRQHSSGAASKESSDDGARGGDTSSSRSLRPATLQHHSAQHQKTARAWEWETRGEVQRATATEASSPGVLPAVRRGRRRVGDAARSSRGPLPQQQILGALFRTF